ncbi:Hypothetical protein, putative [Bodo saltans]|uniref:Uncharacterized protein n=1 Tax=Bodo saltans TaxID=75058 RepID=A0A0S4IT42_BODSA|nr:Hypothetical protein, putative [Bodo saltans]|eukprot:CUF70668.1 Hypothetical protein, putative [Bodo saltans]
MPSPVRKLLSLVAAKRQQLKERLAALRNNKDKNSTNNNNNNQQSVAPNAATNSGKKPSGSATSSFNTKTTTATASIRTHHMEIGFGSDVSDDVVAGVMKRSASACTAEPKKAATTRASNSSSSNGGSHRKIPSCCEPAPWSVTNTRYAAHHLDAHDLNKLVRPRASSPSGKCSSSKARSRRARSPPLQGNDSIILPSTPRVDHTDGASLMPVSSLDDLSSPGNNNSPLSSPTAAPALSPPLSETNFVFRRAKEESESSLQLNGSFPAAPSVCETMSQPPLMDVPAPIFAGWEGISAYSLLQILTCPAQQFIALKMLLNEAMQTTWNLYAAHAHWCPAPPTTTTTSPLLAHQQPAANEAELYAGDGTEAIAVEDPLEMAYFQFSCQWRSLLIDICEYIDSRCPEVTAENTAANEEEEAVIAKGPAKATTVTIKLPRGKKTVDGEVLRKAVGEVIMALQSLDLFQRSYEMQMDLHAMQGKWAEYYQQYQTYADAYNAYQVAVQQHHEDCIAYAQLQQEDIQRQQQHHYQHQQQQLESTNTPRYHSANHRSSINIEYPSSPDAYTNNNTTSDRRFSERYLYDHSSAYSPAESSNGYHGTSSPNFAQAGGMSTGDVTPTNNSMSGMSNYPAGTKGGMYSGPSAFVALPPPPVAPIVPKVLSSPPTPPCFADVLLRSLRLLWRLLFPKYYHHHPHLLVLPMSLASGERLRSNGRTIVSARESCVSNSHFPFTSASVIMKPPSSNGSSPLSGGENRRQSGQRASGGSSDGATKQQQQQAANLDNENKFVPLNWGLALSGATRGAVAMERRRTRLWAQTVANAALGFRNDDEDY